MIRKTLTFCLILLGSTYGFSQERKPWVVRTVNKIGAFIDTLATHGVDKRYIDVPKQPWQVILKFNTNNMDMRSTSTMSEERLATKGFNGDINFQSRFHPTTETSLGAWLGYRGYGLGYSISLTGKSGFNFSIGATGAVYGINLRLRRFNTDQMEAHLWGHEDGEIYDESTPAETWEPVSVHTSILTGYYMFNGKRFSYAAAYDQSVRQIRSAGSLMVGVMWYQASLDYSDRLNALMIQGTGDIGRLKMQEASLGVGYSYNWVPVKNLMINVTALPMLSVYNRSKVWLYDSNYDIFLKPEDIDPITGLSPSGKKMVPEEDDEYFSWMDDITLTETGTVVKHGKMAFNVDLRMSVTYNFDRYFLNVFGQYNHYHHDIESHTLKLSDWYINASLGIRL